MGYEVQCSPSALVAKRSRSVVQPPATLIGYTAQYSLREGTHSTSMCQAKPSGSLSDAVLRRGPVHSIRTSGGAPRVVDAEPQPIGPAVHAPHSHSVELRRTIVGEMIR